MWTFRSATHPRVHARWRPDPWPWISMSPPSGVFMGGSTPAWSASTIVWYWASVITPFWSPRKAWCALG